MTAIRYALLPKDPKARKKADDLLRITVAGQVYGDTLRELVDAISGQRDQSPELKAAMRKARALLKELGR